MQPEGPPSRILTNVRSRLGSAGLLGDPRLGDDFVVAAIAMLATPSDIPDGTTQESVRLLRQLDPHVLRRRQRRVRRDLQKSFVPPAVLARIDAWYEELIIFAEKQRQSPGRRPTNAMLADVCQFFWIAKFTPTQIAKLLQVAGVLKDTHTRQKLTALIRVTLSRQRKPL